MSILVRREQERYFFRLKTAVNYGTVKRQAGAEVSSYEVSCLGFFFRSQQLPYKIVYRCIDLISSKEDTTENTKHLSALQRFEILINKFLSFSVLRHTATGKFICPRSFASRANICFKNIKFPRGNCQPIVPRQKHSIV